MALVVWHLHVMVLGPSGLITEHARQADGRVSDVPYTTPKPPKEEEENPCCFSSEGIDLLRQFDAEFEEEEATVARQTADGEAPPDPNDRMAARKWPPDRYHQWKHFATNTTDGAKLLQAVPRKDCMRQWAQLVLHDVPYYELKDALTNIMNYGETGRFKWFEEVPNKPRLLMLGDSVSVGVWLALQDHYGVTHHGTVNLKSAPTNCLGLPKWEASLDLWLGKCPWDLIHFNIGHHYRPEQYSTETDPEGLVPYQTALRTALSKMVAHSPKATIVIALTTPSPFDDPTLAASLTPQNCPNYHKLFPAGVVGRLNAIAQSLLEEFAHHQQPPKILLNDRYQAVLPTLADLQKPCDIHFSDQGYQFLAHHDYQTIFQPLLGLESEGS